MPKQDVAIKTADGVCNTSVFTPAGSGKWPAAIFYMDAFAIRPALFDMAQRLADFGYVVLLPDLFYRTPHAPLDPKAIFGGGTFREVIGPLMGGTDKKKSAEDTRALIAYIDTRSDVAGKKIGVTGYCMGGGMALTAAGNFPDRIVATASFHGGNIAVADDAMSPHKLAPKMKGFVYVAGADNDGSYPPEQAALMEKSLSDAGVAHKCEIYPGALHGWTMPDFPIYNHDAAERHWRELSALFARTLA